MEFLHFDVKRNARKDVQHSVPSCSLTATSFGGSILVDSKYASVLRSHGYYGHELGERQDRILNSIFKKPESADSKEVDVKHPWSDQYPAKSFLRISPEETAFLGIEHDVISVFSNGQQLSKNQLWTLLLTLTSIEKVAVYYKLKSLGWTVRPGISFGCQYLIYREGPENYHASAGVRIGSALPSHEWAALNRALLNVKKALVMAKVSISPNLDLSRPECLSGINVVINTTTTIFPEHISRQ